MAIHTASVAPFASVTELQSWMQDPEIDAAAATLALAAATSYIQGETGQTIAAVANDTAVFDGVHGQWLVLPQRPVTSVASVAINGSVLASTRWTLANNRLFRDAGWNRADVGGGTVPALVTVVYSHGYTTIPDDVKAATLALAADAVSNPQGLISEDIDDYRWRRSESGDPTTARLLAAVVRRYGTRPRSVWIG